MEVEVLSLEGHQEGGEYREGGCRRCPCLGRGAGVGVVWVKNGGTGRRRREICRLASGRRWRWHEKGGCCRCFQHYSA